MEVDGNNNQHTRQKLTGCVLNAWDTTPVATMSGSWTTTDVKKRSIGRSKLCVYRRGG